jgi:hypothetical protein
LKYSFDVDTAEEARKLEKTIKGRGIMRYLADKGILQELWRLYPAKGGTFAPRKGSTNCCAFFMPFKT